MEKLDRRVVRTRQMLRKSLLDLILTKGYDAVTVQNITDHADLRRATFYLHYRDKEELLLDALETTFADLVQQSESVLQGDLIAGKTRPDAFQVTFDHVAANADLYRILLTGQGAAAITRRIRTYIASHILASLRQADESISSVPFDVLANYLAGAEVNLVVWWLESGMPYSAADMARMAHRLSIDGIARVLGFDSEK